MFTLSIDINGLTVSSDTNGVDLYLKGLEYEESGDYKNAREMFQRAIHHGDSYYAPLKLGQYYLIGVTGDKFSQNVEEAKIEGAKLVLQAAEKGNPWAMNLAAYLYTIGEGVQKDDSKANEWILLSADKYNNPLAKLINSLLIGDPTEDVNNLMIRLYQAAAEGIDEAQEVLITGGEYSQRGLPHNVTYTDQDITNSIVTRLYNQAPYPNVPQDFISNRKIISQKILLPIDKGIIQRDSNARLTYAIESMIHLGTIYFRGEWTSLNKEEGSRWLKKASLLGDAEAQTFLAHYYFFDQNNKDEGLKWYLKAANNNYLNAIEALGSIYSEEKYGMQDFKKAFHWLKKACEEGEDANAMIRLSYMYLKGEGINQDDVEAFNWINKAAGLGSTEAIVRLGIFYGGGIGVKEDKRMQLECYKEASDKGSPMATYLLGIYYLEEGEYQDKSEGFRLIKQAAQKNYPYSQGHLSLLYQFGIGCDKNLYEAERWANKAVENNCSYGYLALADLYSQGGKKDSAKALEYIDKGIELYNKEFNSGDWFDAGLYFLDVKGKIYLRDNKLDKAREIAEEIIKINPDYKDTEDNSLMDFYFNRKQGENGYRQSIICDVDIEIPESNIRNDKTFAVIIGNENYQEAVNVEFANNDAQSFANYCEKVLGLPKTHIRVYNDATYGKMINALSDIKAIAKAHDGDINIIFYYAGHGIPNEKDFSSYLLPVDADGLSTNLCLSLSHLYDSLSETNANRILVLLDACFSGATRSSGMLTAARGVAIKAQPEAPRKNMVIISAASGNETAYPYKEQGHGLFTYYLLKKLQQTKGNVTLSELSNYIMDNVKKQSVILNRKPQSPTISGSVDLNTNWFNSK